MTSSAAGRLDPVGRFRLPGRPALLRGTVAAVLLLTAAGVLYAGRGSPAGTTPPGPATASPGSPAGTTEANPDPDPDPDPVLADPSAAASLEPPDPGRLAIPDGLVGVPVGLGDPARLATLRPGDRVDLLAIRSAGADPVALAAAAPVLAVDHAAATLLLAVAPDQARTVVSIPPSTPLAVIVRS